MKDTLQNWWNGASEEQRKAAIEEAVPELVRNVGDSAAWSRMSWEELNNITNRQRMHKSQRRQLAEYLEVENK